MKPLDLLLEYSTIVGWFFAGLFLFFMLYMRSKFVPREEHDKLKTAFDAAVKRIDTLESKVDQLPSKDTIQKLMIQITSLEGELKSFVERFHGLDKLMDRMQTQADRMEDYLKQKM